MATSSTPRDRVPDVCTLPTVEQPIRVDEFDRFFRNSVRGSWRPEATRRQAMRGAAQ